jgi:phosphohistidine phosphatase
MAAKRLFLLRHAKSSWDDSKVDDHSRPLNERGKRDAPRMGRQMRQRGCAPDRIASSSAVRAYATARAVARELRYRVGAIVKSDERYLAEPATLLACVHATSDAVGSLMLVAHNPGLTDFANALCDVRIDNLPTCGLYCVDFPVGQWREATPGGATFVFFDYPKNCDEPER